MKNIILQNLLRSLPTALLLFGCTSTNTAYYKGSQPVEYHKLPSAVTQPVPQQATPNYYSQPYAPRPQYAPVAPQPYQQRQYGGSRSYSDPYAFPAQYPYYDSDHYYVPPSYYNSSDSEKPPLYDRI